MSPNRSKNAPSSENRRLDGDRLTRLGRVTAVTPSPCGRWLVAAVARLSRDEARYVSDLWRVPLGAGEAVPTRLTRGDVDDRSPRYRHDGALMFLSDRPVEPRGDASGDPRTQVWMIPAAGGEPSPVTDEPLGVREFRLAADTGDLFILADVFLGIPLERQREHAAELARGGPTGLHYTDLPVRHWDHWLAPQAPHIIAYRDDRTPRDQVARGPAAGRPRPTDARAALERVDLTPDADREHRAIEWVVEWNVSGDGSKAVVACARSGADRCEDTALRVIDTATAEYTDRGVVPYTSHGDLHFSPDGRTIACVRTTRRGGQADRRTLWLYDAAGDAPEGRATAADWDRIPSLCGWTRDGAALLATADDHGSVPLFRIDVASGAVARITATAAGGSHLGVVSTRDGAHAVGLRHRLLHPPEPFRVALEPDATPEVLACLSGFSAEAGAAIARWEPMVTAGADGVDIESFVVLPADQGPFPGLVWIHGGPEGQWGDGWHWRWNPLVATSAGYAVVLPNPRGSTGRGQQFIQGIWNNAWGATCYDDLMAVVDAVAGRDDVDGGSLAAMGGSFGGYMANWIGANNDRFRCLISHAGIYSLSAFTSTTDRGAHLQRGFGVSLYRDLDEFDRYSASRRVGRWKTPTLIIHGERDYRVPIGEALAVFDALRQHDVAAELLVFPDENHWIQRPQNIRLWYRTVLDFLAKYLEQ